MQQELLCSLGSVVELNGGLAAGKEVQAFRGETGQHMNLNLAGFLQVPSLLPCPILFLVATDYWHPTELQNESSTVLSGFPGYASLSLIVDMVFIP